MKRENRIFKLCATLTMLTFLIGLLPVSLTLAASTIDVTNDGSNITVKVNGIQLSFAQPPYIANGSTMVPFRAIAEALGAQVYWDQVSKKIAIVRDQTIELTVDSKIAKVNGTSVTLDNPAVIAGESTMVPLRFVGESMGAKVSYTSSMTSGSNQLNGKTATGQQIQIYIDGVRLNLSSNYPFVENGVVYVPAKEVFKALGAFLQESYSDGDGKIYGERNKPDGILADYNLCVSITGAGGGGGNHNGQIHSGDTSKYINNEFFAPVSFADAVMEVETTYNASQNRLDISTGRNTADFNLQNGSTFNAQVLKKKTTRELQDNKIKQNWSGFSLGNQDRENYISHNQDVGIKRISVTINNLDWNPENWNVSEMTISKQDDDFYTELKNNGTILTYNLIFKDKDFQRQGGKLKRPRFKDEDEIQRYLDYVRFTVKHFKGRVKYYEVWNEPNIICDGYEDQYIEPEDYIKIAKRVIPIVREEDPEAKIVVGSTADYGEEQSQAYTEKIITSDLMPLVDVVAIHAPYWESPEYMSDFYYDYPQLLENIKKTAWAHGFKGEFAASEGNLSAGPKIPSDMLGRVPEYSYLKSAKYTGRYIVTNLASDFEAGACGIYGTDSYSYAVIGNLCTLMAGAKPVTINIEILSAADKTRSYAFSLPNGDRLVAAWNDGAAKDMNSSTLSTIKISQAGNYKVTAVDVLNSFEQDIEANNDGGNIIIENFNLKDYPVFFRLRPVK